MKTSHAALALLALAAAGCSSNESRTELSAGLENQMNRYIRRVQVGRPETLFRELAALSAFGRHAVDPVKEDLLGSENPRVRSNAVYVLGEIYRLDGDPVAFEAVQDMLHDADQSVRLEAARALVDAGDFRALDELVRGLQSEERIVRIGSFQALRRAAGSTYGYDPDVEPLASAEAAQRFADWASTAR